MLKWYVNGFYFLRFPLWIAASFTLASCTPSAVNLGKVKNLFTNASSVNLNATPADSQVSLTWETTPNATAYDVARSTSPDGPFAPINTNVQSASFVDTAVTNGVTYYYQVVPKLQNGTSGKPSLIGSATPLSPPAGLNYAAAPFIFTKNAAITPATMTNTGGAIATCDVNPILSAGLVLNPSTCELSGTPTALSTATTYTVRAINGSGFATTIISISVQDIAPAITYTASPYNFTLGQAASISASSSGGAITNCSIAPPLPAGLSISTSSCSVSGTPTALSSNATYTSTASSFGGSTSTATFDLSVTAVPPSALSFAASPVTLMKSTAMTAISTTHSGGILTACSAATLPAGLSVALVSGECQISGTPTVVSTATNYTVTALNSGGSTSATVNFTVNDVAPSSLSFSGSPFSFTKNVAITAANSTHSGGVITACSTTGLPAGLGVSLASGECQLNGTPSALSTASNYTISASNSTGSVNAAVNITVHDVAPSTLAFVDAPYTLTQNSSMTASVSTHSGGTLIGCSAGSLPAGISVSLVSGECQLSGTPTTVAGASVYSISASNSGGSTSVNVSFTINAPAATGLSFAAAPFTSTKNSAITAADSTHAGGPLTGCSASGLPAGLSIGFVAGECRLSGTPTAIAPSANYTVSATNAGGTITASISITVNDVVPSALAYAGSPFTLTQSTAMTAATSTHSGGAITACLAASLPSGLAVNLVSGECEISGTPTSASASASYPVTASNSGGSVTSNISITVNSAVVAPGSLAFAGAPFTLTVNTAMTSVASTHTGSAITSCSGTLPAGLTLTLTSGECVLAGSPTSISTATNYTLTGTNSAGSTPKVVNITVNDAAPTTLAYAGAPFTFSKNSPITAASSTHLGGTITSCSAPGLPTGLSVSLVSGECQLSGTPTAVTSGANYTFSAINSGGTATASVSIIVNDIALTSLAFAGSPFSFTQSSAIIAANSTHSGGTITTCTGSSLPAGLSMSVVSGECQLSGTPTASSTIANYTITAGNSAGTTTASISITVNAATLAAPTGLAATGASLSVGLSWTQASGTTGYKVYRKASASVTTADSVICNVTPGTTTSCTDSTVAAGTTYYYAITSVNGGSESAISTSVSALTLPAAPTGLLAGPGNLKNMISWSAVAGAASYTVKRGASGGPYSTTVTCSTSTATSCTETGLTNGTSYYYVVIANNATGAGPASVQITSIPVASNKLGFVVSPGGQTYSSGVSFSPSITVAVKNTGGTTMTTTTNAITLFLSINTVGGTITGTLTRNAVNGVATFDDIKLDALATNYQMRASSTGLISAPTTTAFSIIAGPATQISLSSIFSLTNTCNGPFTIQALDANNNPSANNSSGSAWAVSLSKSTGSASFYASTDPTCAGSTVSSASIAIGANSTSFYVKDTAADTFTLTANGSGSGIGSKSTNLIIHAAAPRSRFIYTADANINAISILKIDANGKPTTYKSATVGIYQNMDLAIDPQNRFLFIADNNYTAYVYAINPLTGLLTLNSSINTVRPINKMVTDPAGKWLYISTDTGVRMYNINQTTGALTSMSPALVTGSTYPSSLAMDPLGRFVYETGNNMVFQYVINSSTGVLTANSPASITTVSSETISIDPTGTYLYVAASSSSGIYQYSISNSGTLVPLSPATISSGFGPTSIIQDTFGRFIYSGDSPNNLLYSFKASSATGVLSPTSPANLTIQSGPYPLAVDSQGKYLFIAAQGSSLLVALTIDQTTGVPTANGNASTGGQTNAIVTANPIKPADPATYMTLNRAPMKVNTCSGPFTLQAMGADEEISDPNGSGSNWTINLSSDTGNAVFYAGTDTTCTGSTVTSVNIAPASTSTSFYLKDATAEILTLTANGIGAGLGNLNSKLRVRGAGAANRFAYQFVGNAGSPIIAEYVVNTDGSLTANSTPTYALTGSPYSISIDPLGRFVYVNSGATFTTLKIDPTTGVLTPSATYTTTDSTTPFFNFTVSANGQYGYSIGDSSNGYILGWSVNATTGAITPNGVQSPYIGSNSLALLGEPLGEHLYLLDTYGGLSVIDLNTANGQISGQQYQPVRIYVAGYPSKIAIDPDGRYLYETYTSGEVGMYKINADGSLTLLSPVTINAGLNPSGIAVDTNGSFAYVVNRDDGTMSMFQINQANGTLTLISLGTPTVATGGLPTSAATDNQGKFAYCLNTNDGSISSFAVNQTNGLLTFISTTTGLGIKAVMSFGFSI